MRSPSIVFRRKPARLIVLVFSIFLSLYIVVDLVVLILSRPMKMKLFQATKTPARFKKKRQLLTIEQQANIVAACKPGEKLQNVAHRFGVDRSTVGKIMKRKAQVC